MTREAILLILFAALMSAAPYGFLPLRRRAFAISDIGTWVALGGSLASAAALGIHLPPSLALAIVLAVKLAHFFLWCALVPPEEVRGSPRAAALFAAAIFLIVGTETLAWPVDGDEPYFVMIAESLIGDRDVDLANQYGNPDSVAKRPDLGSQPYDPVGPNGELYSRHEPFLAFLLIPGVALGGLWGAMATIALLGALATGSMLALAEESGMARRATLRLWPLIAFAPPFLFYAVRIWPEVPGALCLSEAMRAAAKRKYLRLALWLVALSLLQLRFMIVAVAFAMVVLIADRSARKIALALAAVVALPLLVAWLLVGNPLLVHRWSEIAPSALTEYPRGLFGLLLDAQGGMLFQAPIWFAAVVGAVIARFSPVPTERKQRGAVGPVNGGGDFGSIAIRAGTLAAIPYLLLLIPRPEWHGGWSPPLRYLVVFTPLVAIAAGRLLERAHAWLAPAAIWTALLAVHGAAFPWRLFHIASGESVLGEWLSVRLGSDVSRLLPSFIRPNGAAWAAAILLIVLVSTWGAAARRTAPWPVDRPRPGLRTLSFLAAAALTLFLGAALRPGSVVHFEDAHVEHGQGLLDPELWTVARFRFTGGWRLGEGESMRFRMRPGPATIHVRAEHGGAFTIDGRRHEVPATGAGFVPVGARVDSERSEIRVLRGAMTFDRIERDDGE
jgi:hypothetical protein